MNNLRPMLAASLDSIGQITLPCFAQEKIDGIRCYMKDSVGLSRKFKPIPNKHIQHIIHDAMLPDGLDGELVTLNEQTAEIDPFNIIQSKVMSREGYPLFQYIVFDLNSNWPYYVRYKARVDYINLQAVRMWLHNVKESYITTKEGLELFESTALANNQEGIILRSPSGLYKFGRSTINEQYLMKLKRFEDDEAIVMGYEELQHNCAAAEQNNFGLTERSTFKDEQISGNMLGSLICKSSKFVEFFKIGSGFTTFQKKDIWNKKLYYLGKTLTYKYQKHGMKNKPRIPIFKGWRQD